MHVHEAQDQRCFDRMFPWLAQCAGILEGMQLFQDAATLYEEGHAYEKAANLCISKLKVSTSKVSIQCLLHFKENLHDSPALSS